jgi:hypothetical protein
MVLSYMKKKANKLHAFISYHVCVWLNFKAKSFMLIYSAELNALVIWLQSELIQAGVFLDFMS